MKREKITIGILLSTLIVSVYFITNSAFAIDNGMETNIDMNSTIVAAEYIPPEESEEEETPEPEEEYVDCGCDPYEYYDDSEYYEEDTYDNYDESYSQENGPGLTKQSGVNQYNGRRETYYSSNVLRHYRIDEWHTDENGVWRDADGYVVVAADDIPEGGTVDTSFGEGKVYDCGVGYDGGTDIYVDW